MRLAESLWLLLLIFVPLPWLAERARPVVRWPSLGLFPPRAWKAGGSAWRRQVPLLLRASAIACLAVAMARPQEVAGRTRIAARGVAIVVALDQSSSMTAEDVPAADGPPISRLEAARRAIDRFVRGRPDDLVGLVVFANYPDLACPPTLDHEVLRALLAEVGPVWPVEDGTNIGDAIVWSLEAALEAEPERKVIVLLTDGANQPRVDARHEPIDPDEAAELVRTLGATLYTVGVGRPAGTVRVAVPGTGISYPQTLEEGYDPEALARWAALGGGRSFGASGVEGLTAVFDRIDEAEKTLIRAEIRTRYREAFGPFVAAALGLLLLDRLASLGRPRRLP